MSSKEPKIIDLDSNLSDNKKDISIQGISLVDDDELPKMEIKEKEKKVGKEKKKKRPGQFSEEIWNFIRKNINNYSNEELLNLVKKKSGIELTMSGFVNRLYRKNIKREIIRNVNKSKKKKEVKRRTFTKEIEQFIRDNYKDFTDNELAEEIEEEFDIQTTGNSIKKFRAEKVLFKRGVSDNSEDEDEDEEDEYYEEPDSNKTIHLRGPNGAYCNYWKATEKQIVDDYDQVTCKRCIRKYSAEHGGSEKKSGPLIKFTDEVIDWIRENSSKSNSELVKGIKEEFDTEVTESSVQQIMSKHQIIRRPDPYDIKLNGEQVDRKIINFIKERKDWEDTLKIRDEIIILYEKNFKLSEIKMIQRQFQPIKMEDDYGP